MSLEHFVEVFLIHRPVLCSRALRKRAIRCSRWLSAGDLIPDPPRKAKHVAYSSSGSRCNRRARCESNVALNGSLYGGQQTIGYNGMRITSPHRFQPHRPLPHLQTHLGFFGHIEIHINIVKGPRFQKGPQNVSKYYLMLCSRAFFSTARPALCMPDRFEIAVPALLGKIWFFSITPFAPNGCPSFARLQRFGRPRHLFAHQTQSNQQHDSGHGHGHPPGQPEARRQRAQ